MLARILCVMRKCMMESGDWSGMGKGKEAKCVDPLKKIGLFFIEVPYQHKNHC